jgi:hypothetical protein
VDAVVSGKVIRAKKKLTLELNVFTGNEVPALKRRYPFGSDGMSEETVNAAVQTIRAKLAEEGQDDAPAAEPEADLNFGIAAKKAPPARAEEVAPAAPVATAEKTASATRGPPALSFVLGGVGAAALGAGALATYWGNKDNTALGQCAPWCQPSTVKHIKQLYVGADISFGVGAAALAACFWLFARSPFSGDEHGYHVDVAATPSGGAVATLSGRF